MYVALLIANVAALLWFQSRERKAYQELYRLVDQRSPDALPKSVHPLPLWSRNPLGHLYRTNKLEKSHGFPFEREAELAKQVRRSEYIKYGLAALLLFVALGVPALMGR